MSKCLPPSDTMVRYRSPSTSSVSELQAMESPLMTEGHQSDDALLNVLHALHGDELAYLSKHHVAYSSQWELSFPALVLRMFKDYMLFLWKTWTKAAWYLLFFPITFWDRISMVVMATGASIVMWFILCWCIFTNIPGISLAFNSWSKHASGGLSLVNAFYPDIFNELSAEQIAAARNVLARPIDEAPRSSHKRVFNLDAAKLLLVCAALMYERSTKPTNQAIAIAVASSARQYRRRMTTWEHTAPGQLLDEVCGAEGARDVRARLHANNAEEDTIRRLALHMGLQYSTISECNSTGPAFCGLFWDPNSTFIIVAFKGTNPTDFMEWAADFTFEPRDGGQWLRGFGKVHGGFLNKIFPRRITPGSGLPYDTINEGIKRISTCILSNKPPGTQINIWTTGHSLGCALASLVYARHINEPRDCGSHTVIRDAYLFAAPILCDGASVNAFNNRMNHYGQRPRTLWRITNGKDAVATLLPQHGDVCEWNVSPFNIFSFAHLGCEIRMRSAPGKCIVSGTHITPGTYVVLESAFHLDSLDHHETPMSQSIKRMQEIPLLGRILCHATGFYWTQLQRVGTGTCEWDEGV